MKKRLLVIACLFLSLFMFSACGESGGNAPTTLTIWFMGGSVDNVNGPVVEAANARLQELGLDIAINPIWTGGWSMGDAAQIALNTGDSSIDIYWTGSWGLNFWNNARVGNFVRLDDPDFNLIEMYGDEMKAALPQALWDAFTADGPLGHGIYGIPGYKDYSQLHTWDVNVTRLEELGFAFDDLFDMDGLNYDVFFDPQFEAAMQAAKDKWGPTFFPLFPEPNNMVQHLSIRDSDLTTLQVFDFAFDPSDPKLPENPVIGITLEKERDLRILEKMHHFWNLGFIDPRMAIPSESSVVMSEALLAGEYLFGSTAYAYGHTQSASDLRGIDARFPKISMPIISSVSAAGSGFGISAYSQNQSAAMQFMNAWYTDTTLATILCEGVEGIHWNLNDEGLVVLDEVGRASYSTWRFGMGNIFALMPRNTDPGGHDYFRQFSEYNEAGTPTALLGFTFNNESIALQVSALTGVLNEYNQALTVGAVNPAIIVPEFLAALKANGLDIVHEELNRQIQEFYNSK